MGAKLFVVLNHLRLVISWACDSADTHDTAFAQRIAEWADQMVLLLDHGFHAQAGDPPNLKVCERGK